MRKIFCILTLILAIFILSACEVKPIEGGESSAIARQEKPSGPILYVRSPASDTASLQFRDEDGNTLLDGSDVLAASAKWSDMNGYYLELEFTLDGKEKFAEATRNNIGRSLGIYVDDILISSPTIVEEINSDSAIISGYFTYNDIMKFFNSLTK